MGVQAAEIGMVGLGVMGRNLVLNMADHGISVVGYDRDAGKVEALNASGARGVCGVAGLDDFILGLRVPRAIMMLVPAGPPVDAVITALLQKLQPGDLIIDGGNSHFTDTDLRAQSLAGKGIDFLGVGISGGERGARHGPSIMPGGPRPAYERVRRIFEAVAARANGEPCVAYLGTGSAGHYVKMVHNGIEYGLMRLIAESYDLMRRGLGLDDDELHATYSEWNRSELQSFLIEITADIFQQIDERTGRHLVDMIRDEARQKGTGMWTVESALELQIPTPTIDTAVSMRHLSALADERREAAQVLGGPSPMIEEEREEFLVRLRHALYACMLLTYAQGLALLRTASAAYGYGLKLESVARIWRGGCIIRAAMLEDIRAAYDARPDLPNLLLDKHIGREIMDRQEDLREVVRAAARHGIAAPAFMASLGYFDACRSEHMPSNLVQAQRDYFGAHTYQRVDVPGVFHTQWES